MREPHVLGIIVDLRANRLILHLDQSLPQAGPLPATIDIGAMGRLIGVDLAGVYLAISDPMPGSELQGRSVEVSLDVLGGGRQVVLPRRGAGWELSFPSGNQCWQRRDRDGGVRTLCAVLVRG